jgi:UDP-glucuronate decarboxylase
MRLTDKEIENIAKNIDLTIFRGSRILCTGATGMVGSTLIEILIRVSQIQRNDPHEIKVLSLSGDFSKISHLSFFKGLIFEKFDFNSPRNQEGFEFVIHAASPASPRFFLPLLHMNRINSEMIDYLISRSTKKFLYISTGEIYGTKSATPMLETQISNPIYDVHRDSYPLSKYYAELKCLELQEKSSIDFKIARLFHTFGPGLTEKDGRSFADFLWQAARGNRPALTSTGMDVRTFLHTADSAIGLIKLFTSHKMVTTLNVGSDIPFTILEFAKKVSLIAGMGGKVEFYEKTKKSEKKIIIPNNSALKNLGWSQTYNLDETIDRTLNWIHSTL